MIMIKSSGVGVLKFVYYDDDGGDWGICGRDREFCCYCLTNEYGRGSAMLWVMRGRLAVLFLASAPRMLLEFGISTNIDLSWSFNKMQPRGRSYFRAYTWLALGSTMLPEIGTIEVRSSFVVVVARANGRMHSPADMDFLSAELEHHNSRDGNDNRPIGHLPCQVICIGASSHCT